MRRKKRVWSRGGDPRAAPALRQRREAPSCRRGARAASSAPGPSRWFTREAALLSDQRIIGRQQRALARAAARGRARRPPQVGGEQHRLDHAGRAEGPVDDRPASPRRVRTANATSPVRPRAYARAAATPSRQPRGADPTGRRGRQQKNGEGRRQRAPHGRHATGGSGRLRAARAGSSRRGLSRRPTIRRTHSPRSCSLAGVRALLDDQRQRAAGLARSAPLARRLGQLRRPHGPLAASRRPCARPGCARRGRASCALADRPRLDRGQLGLRDRLAGGARPLRPPGAVGRRQRRRSSGTAAALSTIRSSLSFHAR